MVALRFPGNCNNGTPCFAPLLDRFGFLALVGQCVTIQVVERTKLEQDDSMDILEYVKVKKVPVGNIKDQGCLSFMSTAYM